MSASKENEFIAKKTVMNEIHQPMSFCCYIVTDDESLPNHIVDQFPKDPYLYRGPDAVGQFLEYIISQANLLSNLLDLNVDMHPLTEEEQERFLSATCCESCQSEFSLLNRPVRDHSHVTGAFRAVLCFECNLKRQEQRFIPVFIHNSSNYDSHFIIRKLGCDDEKITVVPNSSEKYISFTKSTASGMKIRFLDSFKFMDRSLSELVQNLPQENFMHTSKFFLPDDLPLVTRKGVFCYEYIDSWAKLFETSLPPYESFRNSMLDSNITPEDFEHAQRVWTRFGCRDLGEFSDIYLKTDVLLLSDVFENFRNTCLQNYQLDPAYYLTLPSLTFDAMLKFTKVKLELLSHIDQYLFIEKGIRGGITSCIKRYAVANNPYLGNDFNPKHPNTFLTYLDANNLYGYAMSQPMPVGNFRWLSKTEISKFDVLKIPDDGDVGYILEVDVLYPSYLHNYHNELPFLPESKCPEGSNQKKLLTTLDDKLNYVCHYVNLKQALQNGLVLSKIHKVLSFSQSKWLKPYIDFNTEKRKASKNEADKDFYKK